MYKRQTFNFRNARAAARIIFETKDLVLGYNEPLTKPLNFQLERGQKIALKGMNGIGKSTLLRTLLGIQKPFGGSVQLGDYLEIGYFEQESSKDNYNTAPVSYTHLIYQSFVILQMLVHQDYLL